MITIPKTGQRFVYEFKAYLVVKVRLIKAISPFKENSFETSGEFNELRSKICCIDVQTKQIIYMTLHEFSCLVQNRYIILTKSRKEDEQLLAEARKGR